MTASTHHWHVAHTLAGHDPDDPDNTATADTPESLAGLLNYELDQASEYMAQTADSHAQAAKDTHHSLERGELFERAWMAMEEADSLHILALNFDSSRMSAPLYKDNLSLWRETVLRLLDANTPLDYDGGRLRIAVWECQEPDCLEGHDE